MHVNLEFHFFIFIVGLSIACFKRQNSLVNSSLSSISIDLMDSHYFNRMYLTCSIVWYFKVNRANVSSYLNCLLKLSLLIDNCQMTFINTVQVSLHNTLKKNWWSRILHINICTTGYLYHCLKVIMTQHYNKARTSRVDSNIKISAPKPFSF